MNAIARTIGGAIGAAVVTSFLVSSATDGIPSEGGDAAGFLLSGGLSFLAVVLIYLGPAYAPGRSVEALDEPEAFFPQAPVPD